METKSSFEIGADFQGVFGEADGRGREQPEGAAAARSRSCTSDHVHDCNVNLVLHAN